MGKILRSTSLQKQGRALRQCRERYIRKDIDLSAYNSAESAADVEALRGALGYPRWNLFGVSYGARLALTIMRDFPEGVRAAILDSPYAPESDALTEFPANMSRSLVVLFRYCRQSTQCSTEYTHLRNRLAQLVDRLNSRPIVVDVIDFETRRSFQASIDGTGLLSVIFQALYSEELIPIIPRLIASTESEDFVDLGMLMGAFLSEEQNFAMGMHVSVQCNEEVSHSSPVRVRHALTEYPRLAPLMEHSLVQGPSAYGFCRRWVVSPTDPIENEPVISTIPSLVLSGSLDPATPPGEGKRVAANLARSHFVRLPFLSHAVAVSDNCPKVLSLRFLDELTRLPRDSCERKIHKFAFMPMSTEVAPPRLERVGLNTEGGHILGLVPIKWMRRGPGVYARGADGLDQTSILQTAIPRMDLRQTLNRLSIHFGLTRNQSKKIRDVRGRLWKLFTGSLGAWETSLAATARRDKIIIVGLVAHPKENQLLHRALLLRVLDSIRI